MASLFQSAEIARGDPARTPRNGCPITKLGNYTLLAALVVDDVIQMVKVPKGATVTNVIMTSTDLDTNGTPLIVLDVGDTDATDDTDRYIDGSIIGRTGGIERANTANLFYTFAADGTVDIHVQAAPATGATTGTLRLAVTYLLQN